MDFQTKVELPAGLPPVSHAERILLMGSCFAENMGRLLAENKFRVDMNPFGILYNPLSVQSRRARSFSVAGFHGHGFGQHTR